MCRKPCLSGLKLVSKATSQNADVPLLPPSSSAFLPIVTFLKTPFLIVVAFLRSFPSPISSDTLLLHNFPSHVPLTCLPSNDALDFLPLPSLLHFVSNLLLAFPLNATYTGRFALYIHSSPVPITYCQSAVILVCRDSTPSSALTY